MADLPRLNAPTAHARRAEHRRPPQFRLSLSDDEEQEQADRQTNSLAGLAVALFLVVASLFIVHQLAAKAAVEDCLLANFSNCDMLTADLR